MELAMVGLGRMGANMARRLLRGGHRVVVWNRTFEKARELESEGAEAVERLEDVPAKLSAPRVVWVMLPHGETTEEALQTLAGLVEPGDILVDGGNSPFTDDRRRGPDLAARGIRYLDAGTSGGVWGLEVGYCLMVGGDRAAFDVVEPALATLAPEGTGYGYMGTYGAGHFVKMVHNGVEYGMMQAYGEGFELMEACDYDLDLGAIAKLWTQGSVVRSWLLDLLADALAKDPGLDDITGYVEDTGEGRWTVEQAIAHGVPMPVIAQSLFTRFRSRQDDSFGCKVLAALRNEFGGHAVHAADGAVGTGAAPGPAASGPPGTGT
jgi:6-phosphogluconate dehydrogenase